MRRLRKGGHPSLGPGGNDKLGIDDASRHYGQAHPPWQTPWHVWMCTAFPSKQHVPSRDKLSATNASYMHTGTQPQQLQSTARLHPHSSAADRPSKHPVCHSYCGFSCPTPACGVLAKPSILLRHFESTTEQTTGIKSRSHCVARLMVDQVCHGWAILSSIFLA